VALGDAGRCPQDLVVTTAAGDRAYPHGGVEVWPGDVGLRSLAVGVPVERDRAGGLQLR
jgi:hypothetical protein